MQRAQQEAVSLGHSYLGTEHLLLGLLQGDGEGTEHLPHLLGVDHQRVRTTILALLGEGLDPLAVTPRLKRVLHQAKQLAAELGQQHIQPDHLLLSLLEDKENLGAGVLFQLGVEISQAQQNLRERLRTQT